MIKNKGFVSIVSLLVMTIMLISSLFLVYTTNLEYLIFNSNKNNIQSYYLGEGKIYKVLYLDEYYNNQLLPKIMSYLKYGHLEEAHGYKIILEDKDLKDGDKYKEVDISFLVEEDRRLIQFNTCTIYNGIINKIEAKVNIINDFFEMKIPILFNDTMNKENHEKYIKYMAYLQEKIEIPPLDDDIMAIKSINYHKIIILMDDSGENYIEFYRKGKDAPVKSERLNKDKIFLIAREPTNLSIKTVDNMDKLLLKGIIYIEGDINIHTDLEFYGILIINQGNIYIDSNSDVKIEGIVLSTDYPLIILGDENIIEINYNEYEIKTNGIYLPGFIDPKIKIIKGE